VLSQFCRKCKENNAGFLDTIWPIFGGKEDVFERIWYLFLLTFGRATSILETTNGLAQEMVMSDEKLALLRQSHTLHPHPERVRDPLFLSGSPFFDPRDLVQVKYELLRRVRVDGSSVAQATALFALSVRPFTQPKPPGNKRASRACSHSQPGLVMPTSSPRSSSCNYAPWPRRCLLPN